MIRNRRGRALGSALRVGPQPAPWPPNYGHSMLIGDRITKEQIIAFRAPSNAASIQKDELLKDVRIGEEPGFRRPARLASEQAKNLYIFEYRGI